MLKLEDPCWQSLATRSLHAYPIPKVSRAELRTGKTGGGRAFREAGYFADTFAFVKLPTPIFSRNARRNFIHRGMVNLFSGSIRVNLQELTVSVIDFQEAGASYGERFGLFELLAFVEFC